MTRWVGFLLAASLVSCRTARGAESREVRLTESTAKPPRTRAVVSYAPRDAELAPAALASQELFVRSSQVHGLAPQTLKPGRSYRLALRAAVKGTKPARVALKLREPKQRNTYRTHVIRVEPGPLRDYALELTAPAFTDLAELELDADGGELTVAGLSLRERTPLAVTEPVVSWASSYVPSGYELVFNDEFSGSALDRRKWYTRYIYGSETLDRLNDENQRYRDNDNHRVAGGVLELTARKKKLSEPSGINYESGMIRSDFTLRYGFFEARVKMPSGLGAWAAFWINSDVSEKGRLSHPPEIDFFEFVNNGRDDKVNKIHCAATRTPDGKAQFLYKHERFVEKHQDYRAPFDFDDAFHTIGAEWTPSDFTIYVDGLKVVTRTVQWKYSDGELAGPAHVLLNLAIGGKWAGRYGIDDGAFPQALRVDWVRVYQKPGGSGGGEQPL